MAYSPERYQANKEKYAAKSKAWQDKNKEKALARRRQHYIDNRQATLDTCRAYHLKTRFGLSVEDYNKLLESQKGVCAICYKKCSKSLAVDHNHVTGKVRGLLCNNCNRGIGHLKDSVDILNSAITYLNSREPVCGM